MREVAPGAQTWVLQPVVIIAAVVLRLTEYLRKDSLWGDEAMLALSIATRPFRQLLTPLGYGQVAAVPFLWAERSMVGLFGVNEWALRALPLFAGIALCPALTLVARRMLRSDETLAALVLVGFSQPLIRYSAEVKPYGLDGLVAVALVGSAMGVLRQMDSRKTWWVLATVGTGAIVLSLTSVFVCLGVGLALMVQVLTQKRSGMLLHVMLLGLVWAVIYTIAYLRFYRPAADAAYMHYFWAAAFLVPGSPHLLPRAGAALQDVMSGVDSGWAVLGMGALTAVLAILGTTALFRRREGSRALLLVVPALAPVVASALGLYPIALRLMLFSAPLLIMLAAVGIMVVARVVHDRLPRVPARWVAAVLLLPSVTTTLAWVVLHTRDQQLSPLVRDLKDHWQETDAVYVFHRVTPAWLYYSTDWTAPDTSRLAWGMQVSGPGGLGHENGPNRGPRHLCEGSDMEYGVSGRKVLLGTSSGVHYRMLIGRSPLQPDSGWAESEARRAATAARPRIWFVLLNDSIRTVEEQMLLDAARRGGGKSIRHDTSRNPGLYLFEFSPGASTC